MPDQPRGLYELLITEALRGRLAGLDDRWEAAKEPLRAAEAPDRIALHLGRLIQRTLAAVTDEERVAVATALARRLIGEISGTVRGATTADDAPVAPAAVLRAILARLPDGRSETIPEPLIPLLDTTVLTNAPGEPRVGSQLVAEIASADRLDVVMAFIRRSGMRPFLEALRRHAAAGRVLRVLTTSYTGSTEGAALDALRALGAEVRVLYDTTVTRLHAKAWLFHRASGFSTAYIGSSNWTHAAQGAGLEWNVRVSEARNPDVVTKMAAVFESYWNGGDFVPYDPDEFASRAEQPDRGGTTIALPPTELRPDPFQERLLEEIAISRRLGHHRNLLVSATGTGKTVMAAIDYQRLRSELPRARLLFVAHRVEILEQSRERSSMRCATPPSASCGSAASGPAASSMSSPPSRVYRRSVYITSIRPTSMW
jgi:HKD family nuclease